MSILLQTFLLSLLPISELRGAIPFAITQGVSPMTAYIVAVVGNLLVIPIVYFFLNYIHEHFMKINIYQKTFDKHIEKNRKKLEKHLGTKFEFFALLLFVAIPLPITGAYTGTLLAWFFGLKKKKVYLALGLGVIIAGIIVTLLTLGAISGIRIIS